LRITTSAISKGDQGRRGVTSTTSPFHPYSILELSIPAMKPIIWDRQHHPQDARRHDPTHANAPVGSLKKERASAQRDGSGP